MEELNVEQALQAQDPVPSEDATQVQAEESAQGAGPWAGDLETLFEDEDARSRVDGYLREKWQPRVTQLEQQVAQAKPALELHKDLNEDPVQTYLAITAELYGDEAAEDVRKALAARFSDEEEQVEEEPTNEDPATEEPTAQLDPRLKEMLDEHEAQKAAKAYAEQFDRIKDTAQQEEVPVIEGIFHNCVIATQGDFAQAYEVYKQVLAEAKGTLVPQPPASDDNETDGAPRPPAALGSDSQGASPTPTQKQYGSIEEAIRDTASELVEAAHRPAPTPVGSA